MRLAPNLANAHNSLGTALGKTGKTDEALLHFLEALRLRPGYAEAHYNLANALAAKGQASQAIEHFRRAVQLSPCWADASNNLAFLEAEAGNLDEAIVAFSPHSSQGFLILGVPERPARKIGVVRQVSKNEQGRHGQTLLPQVKTAGFRPIWKTLFLWRLVHHAV